MHVFGSSNSIRVTIAALSIVLGTSSAAERRESQEAVRQRFLNLDVPGLSRVIDSISALTLAPFGDTRIELVLDGSLIDPTGSTVVEAHIKDEPVPVSRRSEFEVPALLEKIISDCLQKNPSHRPQSADALRIELRDSGISKAWLDEDAARWWEMHRPESRSAPSAHPGIQA